jgi:hypothetical protein
MKKYILLSLLVFIICSSFKTPACFENSIIKEIIAPDYRDAYTGIYFCNTVCTRISRSVQGTDVSSDTASIRITKDVMDSVMRVSLGNYVLKIKLISGTMQAYPKGGYYKGCFFASDSIVFNYSSGRATSYKCIGKKN